LRLSRASFSASFQRGWWRRALELFGTFKGKHGDIFARQRVAEYRKQKAREELPITDPERHLGLRVSRLEDIAKGLVVDGDGDLNDLGENFELKDDEYGSDPNTGYSIHSPSDARNHERPNHLRLFQDGWEPRSFQDRHEDADHIARVREMERPRALAVGAAFIRLRRHDAQDAREFALMFVLHRDGSGY
jgi:hypothetical protein